MLQVALMACAGGPTPFLHSLLVARLGETCVLEETSVGAYGIILRSSRRGCGHGISTTLGTRSRRMRSRRARIPGESPRCANTRRSRCSSPGTTVTPRTWSSARQDGPRHRRSSRPEAADGDPSVRGGGGAPAPPQGPLGEKPGADPRGPGCRAHGGGAQIPVPADWLPHPEHGDVLRPTDASERAPRPAADRRAPRGNIRRLRPSEPDVIDDGSNPVKRSARGDLRRAPGPSTGGSPSTTGVACAGGKRLARISASLRTTQGGDA